jgi:pimeloyl-ACP methyl ester carboxylesterase
MGSVLGLILVRLVLGGSVGMADGAFAVPRFEFAGHGRSVEDWLVIGPFAVAPETDPWETDYLARSGLTEATCDAAAAEHVALGLAEPGAVQPGTQGAIRVSGSEFIDFEDLFQKPYTTDPDQGVVYASCIIQTDSDRTAYLLAGSADAEKIWLNGEALKTYPALHGVNTYQDALRITLRRGGNFLLVKVVRWHNPAWGLTVRIEPTAAEAAAAALSREDMINSLLLLRRIIDGKQYLNFEMRGVPADAVLHGIIRNRAGQAVAQIDIGPKARRWRPSGSLAPGIYTVTVSVGDGDRRTYSETFCIGNVDRLAADLLGRARRLSVDDRTAIDVGALCRRLEILLRPENRRDPHTQREMEGKFVYTLDELETLVDRAQADPSPPRDVPGLHIRGFRSRIDDSLQYYRVFVPDLEAKPADGMPLAVMLAPVPAASRPFIESVFVSEHEEAEHLSAVAARHGLAVLWPGYRTLPTGAPCELTHLDEVLTEVERDYRIDRRRIYLIGECTGGAEASNAAVQWPGRFAAIGLLNPIFDLPKCPDSREVQDFGGLKAFQEWVSDTSEVPKLLVHSGPPIHIICDGEEPGHGHLDASLAFMDEVRQFGFPATFEQRGATLANHFGAWEYLFRWLESYRAMPGGGSGDRTADSDPGESEDRGVMSAFSRRFLVVEGTGGDATDREAIRRISGQFQAAWRAAHFGSCRVEPDNRASLDDPGTSTFVLIGNQRTNRMWRSISGSLPVTIRSGGVTIGSRTWTGRSLAFIASLPFAAVASGDIVLLGSNNLGAAHFGTLNLSANGWFDYAVWSSEAGHPALIDAGNWSSDAADPVRR